MDHLQKIAALQDITIGTLYLIGLSFVLGSLVTILILIIFDWLKYTRRQKNNPTLPKD